MSYLFEVGVFSPFSTFTTGSFSVSWFILRHSGQAQREPESRSAVEGRGSPLIHPKTGLARVPVFEQQVQDSRQWLCRDR